MKGFVSMPSAGSSHFYMTELVIWNGLQKIMCQCPRRALLISTLLDSLCSSSLLGVNALGGLFSFLHRF